VVDAVPADGGVVLELVGEDGVESFMVTSGERCCLNF
jgi:hypothetical protein